MILLPNSVLASEETETGSEDIETTEVLVGTEETEEDVDNSSFIESSSSEEVYNDELDTNQEIEDQLEKDYNDFVVEDIEKAQDNPEKNRVSGDTENLVTDESFETGENNVERDEQKVESQKSIDSSLQMMSVNLPYREGDSSPEIREIKKKLNKIGFSGITETNYFGSFTTKRVKEFQENYGISTTGIIDQETLDKIDEVYYSPFQLGNSSPEISLLKEQLNSMV